MDIAAHIPPKAKNASYLRDTSNNKVSHFRIISRPDCANTNELVNPFDGPSHRRYHVVLIDKSPMATTLGLNVNAISLPKAYREERTACRHGTM